MNYLRVVQFVVTAAGKISFLPFLFWLCDLVVLTLTRILTDRNLVLFAPRISKRRSRPNSTPKEASKS